jgi:hypothetical protein
MRDFIGPILGAILFVAVATAIILCFLPRAGQLRSSWPARSKLVVIGDLQPLSTLALAMATSYVIGVAAAIGLMILKRLWRYSGAIDPN